MEACKEKIKNDPKTIPERILVNPLLAIFSSFDFSKIFINFLENN